MPDPTPAVGGLCLPMNVEAMESLPVAPGGVLRFDFSFRQIRFAVRFEETGDGGIVKVVGDAGPMPFSAEAPAARAGLAQIMLAANDHLGPCFRQVAGRILLGGDTTVARPVTATRLIAAVATVLVPATRYLDLIAVYLRPPLAPARPGEPVLRPEWRRKPIAKPAR